MMVLLHTWNTIYLAGLWSDNCGYFINDWRHFFEKTGFLLDFKIRESKEIPQGGKNYCGKNYILPVQEKRRELKRETRPTEA